MLKNVELKNIYNALRYIKIHKKVIGMHRNLENCVFKKKKVY